MKKVLINQPFMDRVTCEKHVAGQIEDMTEARIAEITAVNPKFITVINSAETVSVDSGELEAAKAEAERLTQELEEANAVIEELRAELEETAKEIEQLKADSKSTKKSSSKKDEE